MDLFKNYNTLFYMNWEKNDDDNTNGETNDDDNTNGETNDEESVNEKSRLTRLKRKQDAASRLAAASPA